MPRGDENKLASDKLKAGGRTYFFDIKEAKSGKPYLMVTESRFDKRSGEMARSRLIFYPEDISEFLKMFQDLVDQLLELSGGDGPAPRQGAYGRSNKRERLPRQQSIDEYYDEEE